MSKEKTFFLVPGFGHKASEPQYRWLRDHLRSLGYTVKFVPITWKRRTMSQYVEEFHSFFEAHRSQHNHVLGFSFGAMVAFIAASKLPIKKLYLCSLSPYFKEDLPGMKNWWKRYMGKRRMADFATHSANKIAKEVTAPTKIFYGEAEAEKFPSLLKRCQKTAKQLARAELVMVKNAPHQLNFPSYKEALKHSIT